MQISDEQMNRLQDELQQSRRAQQAYDLYIKKHIETVTKSIYESIEACSITDTETLIGLKGLLSAIRSLERSVLNDIDTGRLAKETLEK